MFAEEWGNAAETVEIKPTRPQPRRRSASNKEAQRRRARHARAHWPWRFATQYDFTDAEVSYVETLIFLGQAGEFEAYRAELENRSLVKPSTQRATERKLIALGLLEVTEQRIEYDRNAANCYRLLGDLAELAAVSRSRGRGVGAKNKQPSGGNNLSLPKTSIHSSQKVDRCLSLSNKEQARSAGEAFEIERAAKIVVDLDQAIEITQFFASALDPEAEKKPGSAEDLIELAEKLRPIYAPTIYPEVWAAWRQKHGLNAALAVIETAVMRQGGAIRSTGGQYLAGILGRGKRPAPLQTLQAIRAARRNPGLTRPSASLIFNIAIKR
jgi:hypothetical protein